MRKRLFCIVALVVALCPASASASSLTLLWDPSPSSNVVGYAISMREPGTTPVVIDVGNVTRWTANNLQNGSTYVFAVRAYADGGLTSAWTAEVSAVASASVSFVTAPASVATGQTGTWTAASSGLDGPAEYRFRRYSASSGWSLARDYTTNASWSWNPTAAESGQYLIEVSVRTLGSTVPFEAQTTSGYTAIGDALPFRLMPPRVDFDGDGRSDVGIFRPTTGMWHALLSGAGYSTTFARGWGMSTDLPVPGDYDGDGRTDLAVFRPSNNTWYVLRSDANYTTTLVKAWGATGDIPLPADYDGDRKTDFAVFRPANSTWYVLRSDSGYTTTMARSWGMVGDMPVPADYDGDGRTDFAVFRATNSAWYVLQSSTSYTTATARSWGMVGDRPVGADYDGDRRADLAVYRPSSGSWYVLQSSTGFTTTIARAWGTAADVPVPLDYTTAGRADVAFFRPSNSTWSVWGGIVVGWGMAGDIPLGGK